MTCEHPEPFELAFPDVPHVKRELPTVQWCSRCGALRLLNMGAVEWWRQPRRRSGDA